MQVKEKITLTQRNGKLEGIQSFGTIPYMNPDYLKRMENKNSVCYKPIGSKAFRALKLS